MKKLILIIFILLVQLNIFGQKWQYEKDYDNSGYIVKSAWCKILGSTELPYSSYKPYLFVEYKEQDNVFFPAMSASALFFLFFLASLIVILHAADVIPRQDL